MNDPPDPRVFADPGERGDAAARLYRAITGAIDAATAQEADRCDAEAACVLRAWIAARDGRALAEALADAPSVAVARHAWRLLATLERGEPEDAGALRVTLVALPLILVAASDASDATVTLAGVLADPRALEALLAEQREFGGARFTLSAALIGADALDIAALPALLARRPLEAAGEDGALPPLDFPPAPLDVQGTAERVHLRFVAGAVLTPSAVDPLRETSLAAWGMPFAQTLMRQLGVAGVTLLALPRPPQRLVPALQAGRAAQREVSAQLFASNAIRKFRAAVGEPTAILSAHRAAGAPGGGELRLSLSSPFVPREAEGFRCPLYPYESVHDVAAMLIGLLRDCRVTDVRVRAGIHRDIDPLTGAPLLFKDADSAADPLH